MTTRRVYERLPDESSKAYAAFTVYRDLGESRTIEKVQQKLSKSTGYQRQLLEWSATYSWVDRATAYDDYIEAQARKRVERDAIRRKADMLKRHADVGRFLQSKGVEYLRADGKGIEKSSDAITAIKSGVDMERKAEGLPEWIFEIVNADDDELTRQYNQLLTEIGSTGSGDETAGDSDTDAGGGCSQ